LLKYIEDSEEQEYRDDEIYYVKLAQLE
jgi:hypothetical protein